jgi:nitrate reductase NapE
MDRRNAASCRAIDGSRAMLGPRMPLLDDAALPRQLPPTARTRRMEIYAFLIVTAVLMPALAVATVGSWGLTIWVYQMIAGPPGPPSR